MNSSIIQSPQNYRRKLKQLSELNVSEKHKSPPKNWQMPTENSISRVQSHTEAIKVNSQQYNSAKNFDGKIGLKKPRSSRKKSLIAKSNLCLLSGKRRFSSIVKSLDEFDKKYRYACIENPDVYSNFKNGGPENIEKGSPIKTNKSSNKGLVDKKVEEGEKFVKKLLADNFKKAMKILSPERNDSLTKLFKNNSNNVDASKSTKDKLDKLISPFNSSNPVENNNNRLPNSHNNTSNNYILKNKQSDICLKYLSNNNEKIQTLLEKPPIALKIKNRLKELNETFNDTTIKNRISSNNVILSKGSYYTNTVKRNFEDIQKETIELEKKRLSDKNTPKCMIAADSIVKPNKSEGEKLFDKGNENISSSSNNNQKSKEKEVQKQVTYSKKIEISNSNVSCVCIVF